MLDIFKKLEAHKGGAIQMAIRDNGTHAISLDVLEEVAMIDDDTLYLAGIEKLPGTPEYYVIHKICVSDIYLLRLEKADDTDKMD